MDRFTHPVRVLGDELSDWSGLALGCFTHQAVWALTGRLQGQDLLHQLMQVTCTMHMAQPKYD